MGDCRLPTSEEAGFYVVLMLPLILTYKFKTMKTIQVKKLVLPKVVIKL